MGTLSVLFGVCDNTLFAALVPKDRYIAANTLLNGSRGLSFVAGPSVSGLLVQLLNAPIALLTDAASFLCSAIMLARIHPVEPEPTPGAGWGISEGLRFIAKQPVLRTLLAATTTLNLFNFIFSALVVLYATRDLGISPGALGVVLGIGAIGALIGAAFTKPLVARLGVGKSYLLGQIAVSGCRCFSCRWLTVAASRCWSCCSRPSSSPVPA